jgi:hypothetical protein
VSDGNEGTGRAGKAHITLGFPVCTHDDICNLNHVICALITSHLFTCGLGRGGGRGGRCATPILKNK